MTGDESVLGGIAAAHRRLETGHGQGKIVLRVSG